MARSPAEVPIARRALAPAGRGAGSLPGWSAGCNAFPNPPPPRGIDGPTQVTVQPGEDLQTVAPPVETCRWRRWRG